MNVTPTNIVVIGATSSIAQACARRFAEQGASLFLAARNTDKLIAVADDLLARGASAVHSHTFDAEATEQSALFKNATTAMGAFDTVLIAHGTLPDQSACEANSEVSRREFEINALSTIVLLTEAADYLKNQGQGTIAVISSVAGDRGRQSNYLYGAAKAAVSTFLEGLRNALHPLGIRVVTIKPGFVDTPMTRKFSKEPLWATPARVADDIVRGIERGHDVVYTPWFWRYIMLAIRLTPEFIFKRLKL